MVRAFIVLLITGALTACDVVSVSSEGMVTPPPRSFTQAQLSEGKLVYDKHCMKCHGKKAEGSPSWRIQGPNGKYPPPPLNGDGHTWHHPTEVLVSVIKDGSPGGLGDMPGFKSKLTDQEIESVIAWFKSLWKEEAYIAWYQRELENVRHKGTEH